jgi:hypothetical protein
MSASLHQPYEESYPVAGSVGGRVIQTIQGVYYVFAGVLTVVAIQTSSSWFRSPSLWVYQALALAVAAYGVALFRSGTRRAGPFIGALVPALVALFLCVLTTASLVIGAAPPVFLIDSGLEFMFAFWWALATVFAYQAVPSSGPS